MSLAPLPEGLKKLGLARWSDVVLHFPSRYDNESQVWRLSDVTSGQFAQVQVRIVSSRIVFRPRRMLLVEVEDDTGSALLRFIYFKDAQKNAYAPGQKIRVLGDARQSLAGLEFIHPRVRAGWLSETVILAQPLVPVYPTTAGLSQINLRRWVDRAMQSSMPQEWLPKAFLSENNLLRLPDAIRLIHQPPADAQASGLMQQLIDREGPAWDRIRFDELVAQQLLLRRARLSKKQESACALKSHALASQLQKSLPFQLTGAQRKVWQEISGDLASDAPMQRLLQGDVGSGKTVIAALAAAQAVGSQRQVAVMAPTELLAEQLFEKFSQWLIPLGVEIALLKGGSSARLRRELLSRIQTGEIRVTVGTHALIQRDVAFKELALVIVDEQHRFGVAQRLMLTQKAEAPPHLLVMTATPIPRTLTLSNYGEMDVSRLDEMPPGRQPIDTRVMSTERIDEVVAGLSRHVGRGGHAYWVCPLVEESEANDRAAAEARFEALRQVFPGKVGLVHGRMKGPEKDAVMAAFASGALSVLISTTVIEVGVDVPNATLMIIEEAERFGLAQLHQLRGRVGRGSKPGLCLLLTKVDEESSAMERLKAVEKSLDGFELARVDLDQRREGDVLGTAQSGTRSQLRLLRVLRDEKIIEDSREVAISIIAEDPELTSNPALRDELSKLERDERADFIEKA